MPFTPSEWARVKDVFDRARPLPVPERKMFVAAACATEPGLQEHVEKLLAAHQLASGFLETRRSFRMQGRSPAPWSGRKSAATS